MLNNIKSLSLKKKDLSMNLTQKKNNHSGRNNSGKIVIRFRSKNNIKTNVSLSKFNKNSTFIVFNSRILGSNSFYSLYLQKEDFTFSLAILLKVLRYHIIYKKIKNFPYFFFKLIKSKKKELKINVIITLKLIISEINFFFNFCLNNMTVGRSIKALSDSELQNEDIAYICTLPTNTAVCNIWDNKKKYISAPLSKGLIISNNSSASYVLTANKKVVKLSEKAIGQISSGIYIKKDHYKHKKASKFLYKNNRIKVLGKSMNVCDRPNGGYKHASKILKTFTAKKIKK